MFVPEEPCRFSILTPSGSWKFNQYASYASNKERILNNGACCITYDIATTININGSWAECIDRARDELLPICLGISYLTGMAVRPVQDLPNSEVMFLHVGDHYPRQRAMGPGMNLVESLSDFIAALEIFVRDYTKFEKSEKARLLVHHWLDALAYWSLEDLTLSTATMLEIIAATAGDHGKTCGKKLKKFVPRINYAADRFGLSHLSQQFRNMRNDLVHEGRLSGSKFPNASKEQCAEVVAEALDWIDQYLCSIFGLGTPSHRRFGKNVFIGINAFSAE